MHFTTSLRPRGSLAARGPALLWTVVALWTAVLLLAILWLVPEVRDVAAVPALADLVTYPLLLMGALVLYVHSRVAGDSGTGWLTVAVVFYASQGVADALIRIATPTRVTERPLWLTLLEVVIAAVVLGLVSMPARMRVPGDALFVGLLLGLLLTVVRLAALAGIAAWPGLRPLVPSLLALMLVLYCATATVLTLRVSGRAGLALAAWAGLVGVSRILTRPVSPDDPRGLVAVAVDVVAVIAFCAAAWILLQGALRESARLDELRQRLATAEASVKADRSVLHDVASSVAGITSASQLLAGDQVTEPWQRDRLLRMLAAESARLERLARRRGPGPTREIDVDATLEPVLVAHSVTGRTVAWRPSGQRAVACADETAEIVGILLDNCARHSGAASARVDVTGRPGSVAITVSDDGRGVDPGLKSRAFDWGSRGADSSGQGIGLHVARQLARSQGGELALTVREGGGTSVTLTLPAPLTARAHEGAHGHRPG